MYTSVGRGGTSLPSDVVLCDSSTDPVLLQDSSKRQAFVLREFVDM